MGDQARAGSKGNKHRRAIFAKSDGLCIYCAGARPATTIDHMPPISMFRERRRPSGLEFPSCQECNEGARLSDTVAALIGRTYPDPPDDQPDEEVQNLLAAVARNVPGLLPEMRAPRASEKLMMRRLGRTEGGGLRISGPITLAHLRAFAARLGFAMHFEATGAFIPEAGGVAVRVYSNVDLLDGDNLPEGLFDHLPPPDTLRQGRKNAADQFRYAILQTDTRSMSMSFASFREAFGVLAITTVCREEVEAQGLNIIVPGALAATPILNFSSGFSAYGLRWPGVPPWRGSAT
jgi:hypothetical protein